jgi:hypothetical protein
MKLLPKQRRLMLAVANKAGNGTPARVVRTKIRGPWPITESPYKTRVPAYKAWLPAESTDVRITVFMKDAAEAFEERSKYNIQAW